MKWSNEYSGYVVPKYSSSTCKSKLQVVTFANWWPHYLGSFMHLLFPQHDSTGSAKKNKQTIEAFCVTTVLNVFCAPVSVVVVVCCKTYCGRAAWKKVVNIWKNNERWKFISFTFPLRIDFHCQVDKRKTNLIIFFVYLVKLNYGMNRWNKWNKDFSADYFLGGT